MIIIAGVLAVLAIVIYYIMLAMYAVASGPKLTDRINDVMVKFTKLIDRR